MLVPNYIKNISNIIKQTDKKVEVLLSCDCKEKYFYLYVNKPLLEDEIAKEKWENLINSRFKKGNVYQYSDHQGNVFIVKKNIFGKIIDKEKLNTMPKYTDTKIVKIKCKSCSKEYIIFDNRIHGYNSSIDNENSTITYDNITFSQKRIKNSNNGAVKIIIKYENSENYEDYVKLNEIISKEKYSELFHYIAIYAFQEQNYKSKKLLLFSEETS